MFDYNVNQCPGSSEERVINANDLGCKDVSYYHCMRDQSGKLGQICITPSWIPSGYCPEYNTVAYKVDAEKCDGSLGLCPDKTYLSNDVLSYSACLKTIEGSSNRTSTPSITTPYPPSDTNVNDVNLEVIIPIIAIAIVVVIVIVIVKIYKRRRKRRQQNGQEGPEEDEMTTLQLENGTNASHGIPEDLKDFLGENSESYFYKTKAYTRIKSIINDGKSVLVVGYLGSGKTNTCFRLYQDYMYHERRLRGRVHKCQYLTKLDDLRLLRFNKKEINVLLLDYCLEHWNYIHQSETKDITWINKLLLEHKKTYSMSMVITMNSFTWEIHKDRLVELKDFIVLNISRGEYELTNTEKERICEEVFRANHAEIPETKEQENFRIVAKTKAYVTTRVCKASIKSFAAEVNNDTPRIGFPLSCALFCRCKAFMLLGEKFFEKPMTELKEEIARLKDSKKIDDQKHYLTLVYVMLKGHVDVQSLDTVLLEQLDKILLAKRVADATSAATDYGQSAFKKDLGDLDRLLYTESPFLVKQKDGFIVFTHEVVHIAVLLDFGCKHTILFLQHCDIDILLKYVISSKSYSDIQSPEIKMIRVIIQRHHFKNITKRFPQEMDEQLKHHFVCNDEEIREKHEQPKLN